jgi:hypothetical protein
MVTAAFCASAAFADMKGCVGRLAANGSVSIVTGNALGSMRMKKGFRE